MSEEQPTAAPTVSATPDAPETKPEAKNTPRESPGAVLRRRREEQGLSAQEAATKLYLRQEVIAALETDDFECLSPAYVPGYLRAYAKLLGLPAETVLGPYRDNAPAPAPPEIAPEAALHVRYRRQGGGRERPLAALSYLAAFALFVLLFAAWWRGNVTPDETRHDAARNAVAAVENAGDTENTAATPGLPAAAAADEPADAAPPVERDAAPTPPGADRTSDAAPTAVAANEPPRNIEQGDGPDTIELRLLAESWVEVRDRNQEEVYRKLGREGQTILLHGIAPFHLTLGFASGVAIKFNGRDFEPTPSFSDGGIARFRVGDGDLSGNGALSGNE